ncbi:DNA-binding protein [Corynebacterium rouxii]|uniref:DNA-binding protein n=1 Tax=Corynebacterium rouxii TaxID=2719119 RepID=UPI00313CD617
MTDTLDLSLKSEVARLSGGQAQRVVLALVNLYSQRVALMDAGRIIAVGKDVLTVERVEKSTTRRSRHAGPS